MTYASSKLDAQSRLFLNHDAKANLFLYQQSVHCGSEAIEPRGDCNNRRLRESANQDNGRKYKRVNDPRTTGS